MTYQTETEIQRYLKRLSKAARGLPRARRRELVAEIEQHIRDALFETPVASEAEMLNLLDRIGEPEEIAAAASGRSATPSTAMETWAIILLLLGGFVALVGWLAGVALLWSSDIWTRREKLIGTLVIPGGLATGLFALGFALAGGVGGQVCSSSGPLYRMGKDGSRHLVRAGGSTCTGGASTLGTIAILLTLAILLIAPIATSIYLGRRLERRKAVLSSPAAT
jgi:hypothetical protein